MVDTMARREPVPDVPEVHVGVEISRAGPMRRWSLRARDPAQLEALLGLPLPRRIGETLGDIACLGPDEWLWRAPNAVPPAMGEGLPLSIVDVAERSISLILEGPAARAALNAGCPLDLELFAVGRTTRTVYEGTEIILHRAGEQSWTVDVWRSFAEWLWLHLNTAASHAAPADTRS